MTKKTILNILIFLPIATELICMLFLPAQIPVHYSMNFEVVTYGNKFVLLLIGVITLLLGIFLKFIYKNNQERNSERLTFRLCVITLVVFNVLSVCSLIGAFLLS